MLNREQSPHPALSAREYPPRPVASAHAIVFQEGKVLLVKRAHPPSQGQWSVPGGVIELGETIRDAVRHELCEECGLEVEVGEIFDAIDNIILDEKGEIRFHYIVIYVLAQPIGGNARPGTDALELLWANLEELEVLVMHPLARRVVERAFETERDTRER